MNEYFKSNFTFDIPSTVAVVGNSGNIIGTSYGEEIDNHGWVIRFNAAQVEGYEEDVGSKTSFRVINHRLQASGRGIKASEADRQTVKKLIQNEKIICKPSSSISHKMAVKFYGENNELYFLRNKVFSLCKKFSSSYNTSLWMNPSLGVMMTILLVHSAKATSVDVYGFGFHMEEDPEDAHYFENVDKDISASHDYKLEKILMKKLHDKEKITLH